MPAQITLNGSVQIDNWGVQKQVFTGTGDDALQTFLLDSTGLSGLKLLGIAATCLSADGTTLYPVGTTFGPGFPAPPIPGASVQVPAGVDFALTITYTACS